MILAFIAWSLKIVIQAIVPSLSSAIALGTASQAQDPSASPFVLVPVGCIDRIFQH